MSLSETIFAAFLMKYEARLATYFIKNAAKMVSDRLIQHYDQHVQKEVETRDWLPPGDITVGITAGASCPNHLIEDVIRRLCELRGISVQALLESWGSAAGTPVSNGV